MQAADRRPAALLLPGHPAADVLTLTIRQSVVFRTAVHGKRDSNHEPCAKAGTSPRHSRSVVDARDETSITCTRCRRQDRTAGSATTTSSSSRRRRASWSGSACTRAGMPIILRISQKPAMSEWASIARSSASGPSSRSLR